MRLLPKRTPAPERLPVGWSGIDDRSRGPADENRVPDEAGRDPAIRQCESPDETEYAPSEWIFGQNGF